MATASSAVRTTFYGSGSVVKACHSQTSSGASLGRPVSGYLRAFAAAKASGVSDSPARLAAFRMSASIWLTFTSPASPKFGCCVRCDGAAAGV